MDLDRITKIVGAHEVEFIDLPTPTTLPFPVSLLTSLFTKATVKQWLNGKYTPAEKLLIHLLIEDPTRLEHVYKVKSLFDRIKDHFITLYNPEYIIENHYIFKDFQVKFVDHSPVTRITITNKLSYADITVIEFEKAAQFFKKYFAGRLLIDDIKSYMEDKYPYLKFGNDYCATYRRFNYITLVATDAAVYCKYTGDKEVYSRLFTILEQAKKEIIRFMEYIK